MKINPKFAILATAILIFAIISCTRQPGAVTPADVKVTDLVHTLQNYKNLDSLGRDSVYRTFSPEINALMTVLEARDTTDAVRLSWSRSLPVQIFTPAVDSVYPTLAPVTDYLGHIIAAAKIHGMVLPERRYATVVYGKTTPILFTDSVMLIGMNHFLGAEYAGYDAFPVYLRVLKTPRQLPYTIAEALVATAYPYTAENEDATLLSRMLYEGALIHAKMALVDGIDPGSRHGRADAAAALGYNDTDYTWISDNYDRIWQELVAADVLYDTSADRIARFISPAPAVRETATMLPGRIGRYVGYRLIADYLKRQPDTQLTTLLSPEFYTKGMQ